LGAAVLSAQGVRPSRPLKVQMRGGTYAEVWGISNADRWRGQVAAHTLFLAVAPFNYQDYLKRAESHRLLGKLPEAARDYTLALNVAPPDPRLRADLLNRRAVIYYLQKD
jgi:hypothetical protein